MPARTLPSPCLPPPARAATLSSSSRLESEAGQMVGPSMAGQSTAKSDHVLAANRTTRPPLSNKVRTNPSRPPQAKPTPCVRPSHPRPATTLSSPHRITPLPQSPTPPVPALSTPVPALTAPCLCPLHPLHPRHCQPFPPLSPPHPRPRCQPRHRSEPGRQPREGAPQLCAPAKHARCETRHGLRFASLPDTGTSTRDRRDGAGARSFR